MPAGNVTVYGGGLKFAEANDPILQEIIPSAVLDADGTFESLRQLSRWMLETMRDGHGVEKHGAGMAAPQVGQRVRMFVADFPRAGRVCINPEILRNRGIKETKAEGCLSYPGRRVQVSRWTAIEVRYSTLRGLEITEWLHGFDARVFQHELDHLNGICKVGE